MPSMLGLTKDKSPHALGNDNSNQQLVQRQQQGQMTQQQGQGSPNGGSRPQSASGNKEKKEKKPKPRKDTILGRNQNAGLEMETLVWRALCDDPESALEYIAKDAVMINPFIFGDSKPRGPDTDPKLAEELEDAEPWLSYKMHDIEVVEIDLMAVGTVYGLTLFRQGEGNQLETVEGSGGSSWRQTAGGDWRLTSMHVAKHS